eukprot:scaffold12364_cov144-Cylindrotheca_fusiformis.AAC.1
MRTGIYPEAPEGLTSSKIGKNVQDSDLDLVSSYMVVWVVLRVWNCGVCLVNECVDLEQVNNCVFCICCWFGCLQLFGGPQNR